MTKKNDFKALPALRRCYEEKDGQVELFWLHPDGRRDPIQPFGASVETLRKIGYRRSNEHEDDKRELGEKDANRES